MDQGGASPSPQAISLPGEECTGAPVGNGAPHHFHRRRCLCDHGLPKWMEITSPWSMKAILPRVTEEPHMKQQGLPEGIPVCDLQQGQAYCHSNVGYWGGRSTYHSTQGVYATPVHISPQAPTPSTWVHRDHPSPARKVTY